MCIDFTDLNKCCPKDSYPLPPIDKLVEAITGYQVLAFFDAHKGYHQILMADEDKEKTSFITDFGTYCYKKMPFGLKNAGATYQRLVDKLFEKQVGRNIEIYVDDMVVKSTSYPSFLEDLRETFDTL